MQKVGKQTLKCKVTVKEPSNAQRLNLAKKEAKENCKEICNFNLNTKERAFCSISVSD